MAIDDAKIKLRGYFENACEILGVNLKSIPFVYDHIGERFRTLVGICETNGNFVKIGKLNQNLLTCQ